MSDPEADVEADVVADTEADVEADTEDRRIQILGWLFALCSAVMIPWAIYLSLVLPRRQVARHYDLAWSGFDVGLFVVLALTAFTAVRRSRRLPVVASANAAMLTVDAWFDVVTAPGGQERLASLLMALLVELPLAAVCVWLAVHGQDLVERRLVVRLRQERPRSGRGRRRRGRSEADVRHTGR